MEKHTRSICFLTGALVLATLAWSVAARSQDQPTISLVKTIEVKSYRGQQIPVDEYVVQPGDTLARILIKRAVITRAPMPKNILEAVLEFNPNLKNPDLIVPGQKLILPLEPMFESDQEKQEPPKKADALAPPPPTEEKTAKKEKAAVPNPPEPQIPAAEPKAEPPVSQVAEPKIEPPAPKPEPQTPPADQEKPAAPIPDKTTTADSTPPPTSEKPEAPPSDRTPTETESKAADKVSVPAKPKTPPSEPKTPGPGASAKKSAVKPSKNKPEPSPKPAEKKTTEPETVYSLVTVQKGDSLSDLLRRQGVPEDMIYPQLIKMTMDLNPDLANPNLIYSGQTLKIPGSGAWSESAVSGVKLDLPKSGPPPSATRAKTRPSPLKEPEPEPMILPTPPTPPSEHLGTRAALGLIFSRIGERFQATGQHFLPLKTGGQITINNQSFPIIELRNGQRIVLDLDRRLPEDIIKLLRANWGNYTIFRPNSRESFPSMLGRLIEMSHYFKVGKKGDLWQKENGVRIKASGDLIIWPSEEDFKQNQAVLISIVKNQNQGTDPHLAAFLATQGLKIMDFYPRGNQIGPENENPPSNTPRAVENITTESTKELVGGVLELLAVRYETDLSIPLMDADNQGSGFNFTASAPIYFSWKNKNFVVAPEGLSEEIEKLLKKHKFQVVAGQSGDNTKTFLVKLLKAMEVNTRPEVVIKGANRPTNQNIEVSIPGVLFDNKGRSFFLTTAEVPENLIPLIHRPRMEVVRYKIQPVGLGSIQPQGPPDVTVKPAPLNTGREMGPDEHLPLPEPLEESAKTPKSEPDQGASGR